MPTYPMICEAGHKEDVVKRIADCETPEPCSKCGLLMSMNYGDTGWAKAGALVFKGHYNSSLGQYVGSQRDVKDAQNKIKDVTGSMPIELGNERPKHNPVKHEVDMREALAYAEKLQVDRGETPNG